MYKGFSILLGTGKMHGAKRVITFCLLTTIIPSIFIVIPLYLRHERYKDVVYQVSESDIIQIHDGQSSFFCQKHSLRMNSSFHAFQMEGTPEISKNRKHIRLKKTLQLPDDTLEYWGFYLLKGATVELSGCAQNEGARMLVVKGERILDTCHILDSKLSKYDPSIDNDNGKILVKHETPAELIDDKKIFHHTNENDDNNAAEETDLNLVPLQNYENSQKVKRNVHTPAHLLDRGVNHGGNAINHTTSDSSVSSFENSLLECYNGNILISKDFPYSKYCSNIQSLEKTITLKLSHDILSDGYYYYIFYSDNDFVNNNIHAVFDIYKPTFQFANFTDSKKCLNKTECEFSISLFSNELVIVEVPTMDGLEHENDLSFLISTCHPRTSVYIVFPIAVLLFILLCAFL